LGIRYTEANIFRNTSIISGFCYGLVSDRTVWIRRRF
jgi:hypothetical protein